LDRKFHTVPQLIAAYIICIQAWCLDAGAGGIIVPHMETVEEMQDVINACRFP
jgi:2-keto-3-deoxy-L-rhamnonate aldolase RhmA